MEMYVYMYILVHMYGRFGPPHGLPKGKLVQYRIVGLIFADCRLSVKTAKNGPHENFPLYGIIRCGGV
jgi:hypothetical protein